MKNRSKINLSVVLLLASFITSASSFAACTSRQIDQATKNMGDDEQVFKCVNSDKSLEVVVYQVFSVLDESAAIACRDGQSTRLPLQTMKADRTNNTSIIGFSKAKSEGFVLTYDFVSTDANDIDTYTNKTDVKATYAGEALKCTGTGFLNAIANGFGGGG